MCDERLTLHDLLLRDWGTDLPLQGGWGGSREDPIIITASDADSVAATRVVTLRGIGNGRGVFWRTISLALVGGHDRFVVGQDFIGPDHD